MMPRITKILLTAYILALIFILSACGETTAPAIMYSQSSPDGYKSAVTRALPDYPAAEKDASLLTHLKSGGAAEVFDAQALPAIKHGAAEYWHPHYTAAVVIAVDRDRTDAQIRGFGDLVSSGEMVSLVNDSPNVRLKFAAICYALEGENFALKKAADLLRTLRDNDNLNVTDNGAPVRICFDFEAAAAIENGENLEIIIPEEGTLSYDGGLLSLRPLKIADDGDVKIAISLENNSGNVNITNAQAELIHKLRDYDHFTAVMEDFSKTMRRRVLGIRLYSSADGREHHLFALVFIVAVIFWINSVTRRISQKGTRAAVLSAGLLLAGWTVVRMIKFNLENDTVNRYLWYLYYLFLLAFPIVIVWIVWTADKPDSVMFPPAWWKALIAFHSILFALVMTNDVHRLVFSFDPRSRTWSRDYTYGIVYFIICASAASVTAAGMVSLAVKSKNVPRKGGYLFTAVFMIIITLYGVGYVARVPIAWESDLAIVVGAFIMLFLETLIRTGLIPVNTRYASLFAHSPLKMQIADTNGNVIVSSASTPVSADFVESFLKNPANPVRGDDDTLVYADAIRGGAIIWHEDVSSLNKLHRDTLESIRRLETANSILAEEEAVKRSLSEAETGKALTEQLESEIKEKTALLSEMISSLPERGEIQKKKETARAALLLCCIKRKCNLFFREREFFPAHEDAAQGKISADELAVYLDEAAEFAKYAGVKVICSSEVKDEIPFRKGALIYDFFCAILEFAAASETESAVIAHLLRKEGRLIFQILPSLDIRTFNIGDLAESIENAGGTVMVKDLDGAVGISLSFTETDGGETRD